MGKNDEGRYALRITANDTGGLFSKHWLSLDDILALLDILKDAPFKSVALKALFVRGSANNHGFLAAILRAEKLLVAAEAQLAVSTGSASPSTTGQLSWMNRPIWINRLAREKPKGRRSKIHQGIPSVADWR